MNIKKTLEILTLIMTTCLLASFTVLDKSIYGSIMMVVITVLIVLTDSFYNNFKITIKFSEFHIWVIGFALYCLLSSLWAINSAYSISKGLTIIQILICLSVVYNHYYKNESENLIKTIEYSGYLIAIYYISFFGISGIKNSLLSAGRLENAFANANTIGMTCAISFVISLYFRLYEGNKNFIIKLPFIIILPIIVAATASRKALAIIILGSLFLFMFKYLRKNILKTILQSLLICCLLGIIFFGVLSLPIFAGLNHRMEGLLALVTGSGSIDNSTYLRQQFIKIGLEQFIDTPLIGIGIDNARLLLMQHFGYTTYLHNNYVELLASGGFVGTSLFYSIYIYIIIKLKYNWNRYNIKKIAFVMLLLMQLAMDFGNVSYYSKTTKNL